MASLATQPHAHGNEENSALAVPAGNVANENSVFDDETLEGYDTDEDEESRPRPEGYELFEGTKRTPVSKFIKQFPYTSNLRTSEGSRTLIEAAVWLSKAQSMDWAGENIELTEVDAVEIIHYLDYTCLAGSPLKPLSSGSDRNMFGSCQISFGNWAKSYSSKHAFNLAFSLEGKSFHIATSDNRVNWAIIMEPRAELIPESIKKAEQVEGMKKSAMPEQHANRLLAYLNKCCERSPLVGGAIDHTWSLGGSRSVSLNHAAWLQLQTTFCENWDEAMRQPEADQYWRDHYPTFHAYDFGQNIPICDDEQEIVQDMEKLKDALSGIYNLSNAATFSCAIASNINLYRRTDDPENPQPLALVMDREDIDAECPSDLHFYPLGLTPRVGNFQSSSPPEWLQDDLFDKIADNFYGDNEEEDVFEAGFFQGYSQLKNCIRHGPRDFLPSKAKFQGALALNPFISSSSDKRKQQQLLSDIHADRSLHRPLWREAEQIRVAVDGDSIGFRFEAILNFNTNKLIEENRNFGYIVTEAIKPTVEYWRKNIWKCCGKLRVYEPKVFPAVLQSFLVMFGVVLEECRNTFLVNVKKTADMNGSEFVSVIERLATYCLTGSSRVRSKRIWDLIGLSEGLDHRGWPYINPKILNLSRWVTTNWPTDPKTDLPILASYSPLGYHYGSTVAESHKFWAYLTYFCGDFSSLTTVYKAVEKVIRYAFLPEMRAWSLAKLTHSARTLTEADLTTVANTARGEGRSARAAREERKRRREELLATHKDEECSPFKKGQYMKVAMACTGCTASQLQEGQKSWSTREFAAMIHQSLSSITHAEVNTECKGFAPTTVTWTMALLTIIQRVEAKRGDSETEREHTIDALARAFTALEIQELPGTATNQLLSAKRVIVLSSDGNSTHGTHLRRKAGLGARGREVLDAYLCPIVPSVSRAKQSPKLHFKFPFTELPKSLVDGLETMKEQWLKEIGTKKLVATHIVKLQAAVDLRDRVVQLALIIISVLSIPARLPRIDPTAPAEVRDRIIEHPKNRDKKLWQAGLFVKMMWWVYPRLRSPEVVKECNKAFDQSKLSTRFLVVLGWLEPPASNRTTPRIDECRLEDRKHLTGRYAALERIVNTDAAAVAREIFRGDEEWTRRVVSALENEEYVKEMDGDEDG